MFKIAASSPFVLSLFAAATAAPAAVADNVTSADSEPLQALKNRAMVNRCGNSSFEDQWSNDSPSVRDCRQIITNISNGGEWTQPGGKQRQLVQHDSFAFGVHGLNNILINFKVGNEDIIDLINDAINRFQRDGKVGAKGTMPCKSDDSDTNVLWGLY